MGAVEDHFFNGLFVSQARLQSRHCKAVIWALFMKNTVKPILKSSRLQNVAYDIRGPVLDEAARLEEFYAPGDDKVIYVKSLDAGDE